MTVANSVFTIFQVISATDQFERETRREQAFQVKVRKTRTNVNELHLAEAKSELVFVEKLIFIARMQAVAQQAVQGSVLQHALQPSVQL